MALIDFEDREFLIENKDRLPRPAFEFLERLAEDKRHAWREFIHFSDEATQLRNDFALRKNTASQIQKGYSRELDPNFFSAEEMELTEKINRLKMRQEPLENRWHELSRLFAKLRSYVRQKTVRTTTLKPFTGMAPALPKGVTWASSLEKARTQILDLHQQLLTVESAPIPVSEAKALARRQIAELAARATIDAAGTVLHGSPIRFSKIALSTIGDTNTNRAIAFDSEAFMARLFGNQMLAAIDDEIGRVADDKVALASDTRAKKARQLKAQMLEIERLEERIIVEIEAQFPNSNPFRRPDADPRAVLHLDDACPEVESDF